MDTVSDPDLPPDDTLAQCPEALLSLAAGSVLSVLPCPPAAPAFLSRARSMPTAPKPSPTAITAIACSSPTSNLSPTSLCSTEICSSWSSASSMLSTSASSSFSSSSLLMEHMSATSQLGTETRGSEVYGDQEQDVTTVNNKNNNHNNGVSPVLVLPPSLSVSSPSDQSISQPGLIHFLRTICAHAKVSELALVISLIYVDRLKKVLTSMARGDPDTPFKIILSALLVVKKFLDEDSFGLNRLFSKITLYTLSDINTMERSFLGLLQYRVFVTDEEVSQFLACHEQELHGLDILKYSTKSTISA
ncbi:hypothetical protein EMPS_01180 [Entomortierella parvispora]|uniref:Cyclin-like domain-containing protein n=1 Tax=Entomortierella parvispora TaxID=205924 RepID=A0A9P3H2D2_9FUNG|nr:hypothetical protein EMPS_01180 [Entomortierella parvispora]